MQNKKQLTFANWFVYTKRENTSYGRPTLSIQLVTIEKCEKHLYSQEYTYTSQHERENTEITFLREEKFPRYKGQDLAIGITSCGAG